MNNIYLIGFMGSGKSYAGKYLSHITNLPHFDLDEELEKIYKTSVNTLFSKKGEPFFRKIESDLLINNQFKGIISTGGGIVEKQINRHFLKTQLCIWLAPEWQIIYNRIKNSNRPLVKNRTEEELKVVYQHRKPFYKACANFVFNKTNLKELIELI
jgi:shikimate kinase